MISIIVPIYNASRYLHRCIDSLLAQTYTDIELILINDGSTDDSGDICEIYARKDRRIQLIHKQNGGVSSARNAGIERAVGEWVGFVDSDDWVEPDMFEKMIDASGDTNQIVICGYYAYLQHGKILKKTLPNLPVGRIAKNKKIEYLLSRDYFEGFLWNKLFSRNLIQRLNLRMDESIHFDEDLLFCLQLFMETDEISYISRPLYHYCLNEGGAMMTFKHKRFTELTAWKKIISESTLSEQNRNLARCRYADSAINMMYVCARDGKYEHLKYLRSESFRYALTYFRSKEFPIKMRVRNALALFFPVLGSKIWNILKNRVGFSWYE